MALTKFQLIAPARVITQGGATDCASAVRPGFQICQNHAFVEGEKRTGANAAITLRLIKDWELEGDLLA